MALVALVSVRVGSSASYRQLRATIQGWRKDDNRVSQRQFCTADRVASLRHATNPYQPSPTLTLVCVYLLLAVTCANCCVTVLRRCNNFVWLPRGRRELSHAAPDDLLPSTSQVRTDLGGAATDGPFRV